MQDEWQMFIINVEEKQIITGKDDIKTEQGRKGIKHVRYRIWSSAKAVSYTHLDVYKRQALCGSYVFCSDYRYPWL